MPAEFVSATLVLPDGTQVHQSVLPTKHEDRTVVLPFEHGTIVAIFDGHHSSELSEYASRRIPQLVADRFDPDDPNLERTIQQIFQDFDRSLISSVCKLFDEGEDWTNSRWENQDNVFEIIGYGREYSQFREGRLSIVGTTVLMAILDGEKKNIWVVSLGDSDAVRGRLQDGKMVPLRLSESHNGKNEYEVQRLLAEHPGEEGVLLADRVLGLLSVTRALGDHQLKAPQPLATRILKYFYPSSIPLCAFNDWELRGNTTPPYISSSPSVQRYDVFPGDILVLASDGLPDSMTVTETPIPPAERWDVLMALAGGGHDERLGHECIPSDSSYNPAELLIRNSLFGKDEAKMATELDDVGRDDISVVFLEI